MIGQIVAIVLYYLLHLRTVYNSMLRLGACYNLFDCEELLEFSIRSLRGQVDYIVVVYQTGI